MLGFTMEGSRKFVMERMAFEFRFEECIGHRCICPGVGYISIHSLGIGNIVF